MTTATRIPKTWATIGVFRSGTRQIRCERFARTSRYRFSSEDLAEPIVLMWAAIRDHAPLRRWLQQRGAAPIGSDDDAS